VRIDASHEPFDQNVAITKSSAYDKAGIDLGALAAQLQDDAAKSFVKSWNNLMSVIASKSHTIRPAK